jgi:hypothetical protein
MVTVKAAGITTESPQAGLEPHDQYAPVFQSPLPKATHSADRRFNELYMNAKTKSRTLYVLHFCIKNQVLF